MPETSTLTIYFNNSRSNDSFDTHERYYRVDRSDSEKHTNKNLESYYLFDRSFDRMTI